MGQFTHDGVVYEEMPGGQVRVIGYAGRQSAPTVVPSNPVLAARQKAADDRAAASDQRASAAEARADRAEARIAANQDKPADGYRWVDPEHTRQEKIPGGSADTTAKFRPLTDKATERLEGDVDIYAALRRSVGGFQNDFAGNTIMGGAENTLQSVFGTGTPGQRDWWADFRGTDNLIRNGLFGASLTDSEKAAYEATTISERMAPAQIQENLQRREAIIGNALRRRVGGLKANKFDPDAVDAYLGEFATDLNKPIQSIDKKRDPLPGGGSGNGGSFGSGRGYENDPSGNRSFITERDRAYQAEVSEAFKRGADRSQMDAIAAKYGAPAFGPELDQAIQQRAANPAAPVGFTTPASGREEAGLTGAILNTVGLQGGGVGDAVGSYAMGAGNAATFGQLENLAELTGSSEGGTDIAMGMAKQNGLPYVIGEMTGSIAPTLGLGKLLGAGSRYISNPFARAALTSPVAADMTYGAARGASEADDPLYGAVEGALLAGTGSYLGSKAGRGIFGLGRPKGVDSLNPGERSVMAAVNRTGQDPVVEALMKAEQLGVPATLADVSPEVNSLAGAAIRRSPTVAGQARDTLIPRGRSQIDRFGQAIERDLGPLDNVPQRSDELIQRARASAGPLYAEAYAAPVISTPTVEELLSRPFGRQAIGRAETIAANEGRNPRAMGFALDASGNPILNPVPEHALGVLGQAESRAFMAEEALKRAQAAQLSGGTGGMNVATAQAEHEAAQQALAQARTNMAAQPSEGTLAQSPGYTTQTLDYVKRGMDDALEQHRNDLTGRLELDEAGKAENGVLRALLAQMDHLNPAYGKARAAYAGPAGEAEALRMGQSALTLNPDLLAIQAGRQSPERLGQMQLGARDSMMKRGEALRYGSNPFEAVLGTPAMEQRLSTLYPDKTDEIARLLAQRDMEGQMAASSNRLIGNSATAERLAADRAFEGSDWVGPAMEVGANVALGQVPIGTALRAGASQRIKDAVVLGLGKRATEKAEQIGPMALKPDPQQTIIEILAMAQRDADYKAAKAALAARGQNSGRLIGTAASTAAIPYAMGN